MQAMMIETVYIPYDPKPIITARLEAGLTQKEAALRARIHVATVMRVEAGEKVTSKKLNRLCDALEIPVPVLETLDGRASEIISGEAASEVSHSSRSKARRRGPSSRHLVKPKIMP